MVNLWGGPRKGTDTANPTAHSTAHSTSEQKELEPDMSFEFVNSSKSKLGQADGSFQLHFSMSDCQDADEREDSLPHLSPASHHYTHDNLQNYNIDSHPEHPEHLQDTKATEQDQPLQNQNHNDDDQDSKQTGRQSTSTRPVCETYPDSENEYHQVIRNQNWDLLEIFLKEYDYKTYAKAKEKPKKPPRKLRVAKYLPELPSWKKPLQLPKSPLYSLDALGRAPLHLCCINPCPDRPLLRLLFCAREVSAVPDVTGSLPLHLAITHERSIEVVDKLIRGYYQGSWEPDGTGRTPLMWALEVVRRQQQQENNPPPPNYTFWGYATTESEAKWQSDQCHYWELVQYLLENRIARRKNLLPREYRQLIQALVLAATPRVVSLFLDLGAEAMKLESICGPALSLCISRQYPLELLEKISEACPMDFPKTYRDSSGRGVVAAHYRLGCVVHQDHNTEPKRESFRMTMQHLANAVGNVQESITPSPAYEDWWEKLKYLINLWGSHSFEDDASHDDFDFDDLLLHNALSNPDVPPSLIRLLAALRPDCTDLEHPRSNALPLHIACRVWRYRHYPPRKGEREIKMDKVVRQLMEGDATRTRKRYRDRLPLHHAVAAGKNWLFLKPLVVHDRKTLHIRDPTTKLYPFQVAASVTISADMETLTRRQYTNAEWNRMKDYEQDHHIRAVEHYYDLEQLTVIFELLRQSPEAIDHETIARAEAERRAAGPKRKIIMEGLNATEEVALSTQMKMIRALFGVGNVSGHFLAWAYESTRRGWKTHRSNFGVLKEAIMDGFVPTAMDKWWRKLKFWIWQDCPWEIPEIPHRDDFLLHGALCNPDASPWIIDLLLECFPRSASIPLPGSEGCYPLHIACITDRYVGLPFEFPNKRTIIEMTAKAFPDATLLKWKNRLPLHLAILHSKDWDEIRFLADDQPVALGVADPKLGFFPFQLMAINRPYNTKQRKRFEMKAQKEVGKNEWKKLPAHEKVLHISKVLEKHELNALGSIYELLKRNPVLVSLPVAGGDVYNEQNTSSSSMENELVTMQKVIDLSGSDWMGSVGANLSTASLDFLGEVYEKDKTIPASAITSESRGADYQKKSSHNSNTESSALYTSIKTEEESLFDEEKLNKRESNNSENVASSSLQFEFHDEGICPIGNVKGYSSSSSSSEQDHSQPQLTASIERRSVVVLQPYDHEELCYPRRKDVLLIRHASAYVIWRNEVLTPGSLRASTKRNYWLEVLQRMSEQVEIGEIHSVRHEKDQTTIASTTVDGVTICIDEDDSYIWILCGEDAATSVENYDVEAAMIITSSLLDSETGVWLDAFRIARSREGLSARENPHLVLDWLLGTLQQGVVQREKKKFMISRPMLRKAFAHGTLNPTQNIAQIIEKSTRQLWFEVGRQKMEVQFQRKGTNITRYLVAKRAKFERLRVRFIESQKEAKYLKKLKKKQRHARRNVTSLDRLTTEAQPIGLPRSSKKIHQPGNPVMENEALHQPEKPHLAPNMSRTISKAQDVVEDFCEPEHLQNIHQPRIDYGDDMSLYHTQIFEPPAINSSKSLLEAALKAKEERDRAYSESSHRATEILLAMNQPKMDYDDDIASLSSMQELFDPPKGPPPSKPLLAAALKAKEERDKELSSQRASEVLSTMNQPKTEYEDDNVSLNSVKDLFDTPCPPPEKRLLAAALKAKKDREMANIKSSEHASIVLSTMNQPKTDYDDDNISLGSTHDLFDAPKDPPPPKPLLMAALQAKEQLEQAYKESSRHASKILSNMNQPKTVLEDDNMSLSSTHDLFDPPSGPPPEKPILAAALKAKAERDAAIAESSERASILLRAMNQPKTDYDDDIASLSSMQELFDPPKGPPPSKPLLAAALKAKEERDKELSSQRASEVLSTMNQPKTEYEDDNVSLNSVKDLFDTPCPPPEKRLLAAALKAKKDREMANIKSSEHASIVLSTMNQPKTDYDDDNISLGSTHDLFDAPKDPPPPKPLLMAALQAKEQLEQAYKESSRHASKILSNMNQPKTVLEDDNMSLSSTHDLFDPPSGPPPEKPILAAALKAKAERDAAIAESSERASILLRAMNQPKTDYDDDIVSLSSMQELFDPPKGPPPSKPLLAAALKAKEERDKELSSQRASEVLSTMNQPKTEYEDDNVSLNSVKDLFDTPCPPPEKRLLAAALKAKEERDKGVRYQMQTEVANKRPFLVSKDPLERSRSPPLDKCTNIISKSKEEMDRAYFEASQRAIEVLRNMNQPIACEDDNESLGSSSNLFEESRGPAPQKPLLAAAVKAKEARDKAYSERSLLASAILNKMNQPIHSKDDENSLRETRQLFDAPKSPPPEKPLLAAALKAKRDLERRSGKHLSGLHQPTSSCDDSDSIGSSEIFEDVEPVRYVHKPFLAAALKAKKQAEGRSGIHLINIHQPKALYSEDDSLSSNELFDPPCRPRPDKPLLAAALKAKMDAEHREGVHLSKLHQPKSPSDDDDHSLIQTEVFDPPRPPPPAKPLLAAALKAKQQAEEERASQLAKRGHLKPRRRAKRNSSVHPRSVNEPKCESEGGNTTALKSAKIAESKQPLPPVKLLGEKMLQKQETKKPKRSSNAIPEHLLTMHQPEENDDDDDHSLGVSEVFDPPKPPAPRKPLLAAALKAKADRDQGIYLGQHPEGILRSSQFSPGSPQKKAPDGSISVFDVFIKSPQKRQKGAPRRGGADRKPEPMRANLVRMNSVDRLRPHNTDTSTKIQDSNRVRSKRSSNPSRGNNTKGSRQNAHVKENSTGSSPTMLGKSKQGSLEENKLLEPTRKKSGIMALLSKRQSSR